MLRPNFLRIIGTRRIVGGDVRSFHTFTIISLIVTMAVVLLIAGLLSERKVFWKKYGSSVL
jgi:hypothetical protein